MSYRIQTQKVDEAMSLSTLDEVLQAMAQHTRDNPTHGYNCACKDLFIFAAKRILVSLGSEAIDEVSYLFHTVAKDTSFLKATTRSVD